MNLFDIFEDDHTAKLYWTDLDESLSVEEKMEIFESYAIGHLVENVKEDDSKYLLGLKSYSVDPEVGNTYIVVPLMLTSRIMKLASPEKSVYLGDKDGQYVVKNQDGEIKKFPHDALRNMSAWACFFFDNTQQYNEFRSALALKFNTDLDELHEDDMFAAPAATGKYWHNTPEEFKELWNELVPDSGAAQTLEGELLRAGNRLYYQYYNNGFGNNVSGAENFLRNFAGSQRMFQALDVMHPYTRGDTRDLDINPREEQAVERALDVMMDIVFYKVLEAKNTNTFHPNPGDMFDYSEPNDYIEPEEDEDDYYDDEDEDDVYEAEVELDEPPAPERKQQTKTKAKFNYDPFQQQKDQPLAQRQDEPKAKSQGPKGFRKATAAGTRNAASNVNIPAQGMDYLRNLNIDIDPDLAPYPDEEPRQEISTEVNTENLPAVAGEAIQAAGMTSPEFHQVARLPGNMSAMIRQLGKKLFGSMTSTPTEEIYMIGNLGGQGPNTRQEVNAVANFVRENGEDMGPGDIDFDAIMPGYQARTHQYVAAGIRWLLVKDFAGEYIYAWPEADSTAPKDQARLREDDDIFAASDRPKHLAAASKWRRGGEASGTGLMGYVITDYDTIYKTFGEPIYVGGDKVPVEWVITFRDGKVATIYVYRISEIPKGEYRWHVGGRDRVVVDRVAALLGARPAGELMQESLTPDGEFLDKASRVKHGDKIYWKMKFVGLATGEVRDGRIFFNPNPDVLGKHMTGIASLPIDQVVIR